MTNNNTNNIVQRVPRNFYPQKVEADHYKFGASPLPKDLIFKDSHGWKDFRPVGETQYKNGIDPSSCPAGSVLNALESIGLKKYKNKGFQSDLSERYLSIMMGMRGTGGWPWDAARITRGDAGAIPESSLPFNGAIKTLKQYFSPNPMSYSLFKIGLHWLSVYDFGYEWVYEPGDNLTVAQKQVRMMEALKYSPLVTTGFAWSLHPDGKYYKDGPDIHCFVTDDYSENDYWESDDTYPPFGKKLDWNYNFGYCMRFSLTRRFGAEDVVYDPKDAPEARIEYIKYLFNWALSKLIKK